jgi:hypothetical protein
MSRWNTGSMTCCTVDWLSVAPPMVHHWLMIHAEPGTVRLVVSSGVR